MNKNLVYGFAAVLAVAVALSFFFPTSAPVELPDVAQGEKGDKGDRGPRGFTGPQGPKGDKGDPGDTVFGAVVGPDNFLSHWSVNGYKLLPNSQNFSQGTSTLCRTPAVKATSTLLYHTAEFNEATATDMTVDTYVVGLEEMATTSGTKIGSTMDFANNDSGIDDENHVIIASTSPAAAQAIILTPNQRVITRVTASNFDQAADKGFNLNGSCRWEFLEL